MPIRPLLAALAAGLATVGVVACGSPKTPPVAAGHGSPAAAATGFLTEVSAGHVTQACSYVLPSQTSICTGAFGSGGSLTVKNLTIGATTVSGNRALVTPLGTLCTGGGGSGGGPGDCFKNSDRRAGQPGGSATFSQAYSNVENGTSNNHNDPAIPCMTSGGGWYVDLGQTPPGPAPSSSSTTTPTT